MKKLTAADPESKSPDLVTENLAALRALFPELVTEGPVGVAVNLDVLKQLVGDRTVTDAEEKYGLNWHGKRRARELALTPSTGTLRPCPEDSVDWETTRNLMIEGDNLEVLKLLQKSYAGKVKLIYIDPPYNTGKDFVYPDNFQDNIKNYEALMGWRDEDGNKVSTLASLKNTEASGRFHTDWLNMMYPRLKLARNLLREDGVIFISINDAEVANLKALAGEVFGDENFVAPLVWEKGRKNDAKLVSVGHEYMLVFAKSKAWFQENKIKWREAKPGAKEILSEYLRLRRINGSDDAAVELGIRQFYENLPKDHPSKKHSRYNKIDGKGVWRDDNMSWPGGGGPDYDVVHPETGQPCTVPEGGWRYSTAEKMSEMIQLGKVVFRADHSEPPIRKTYLVELDETESADEAEDAAEEDGDDLPIQVAGSYFYRSALQASNELNKLFGKKVFNNPKDREVLARWIDYVGTSDHDIVMDFFAGSGTTGHAVMDLASAQASKVRYILVQLPEIIDPKAKGAKPAVAFLEKLGKPRTIAELTKERLRRAGKKIREENPLFAGDLGFRVFKLASSNIRAWEPDRDKLADSLFDSIDHLKADRTEQDILFELLLKLGLDLCVPIETRQIVGAAKQAHELHSIGGGSLLVCLSPAIPQPDVEPLALGIDAWHKELKPAGETTVVFRDSAFADDVAKTNLTAILQQHGLETVRSL
ncbi:MAG: site-specific DNA-methyltransferase [Desulfobulbaceae bacterium A2]|nr:MAG: site-specific DNA-methyltransferase [Desulfobulbaceae bacterium A2]